VIHEKVKASGAAGAVTVLLVFALEQAGVSVPPEVASALTTVIGFVAGYLRAG